MELASMVSDPDISNRDLLAATALSSRGLPQQQALAWTDNLIEFSLSETGRIPERLGLCSYLVSIGAGRIASPQRWRSFGGLLHIACEAGSIDAIEWALLREPLAINRPGGSFQTSPFHALQMNESESVALAAATLLAAAGCDINARSVDGQTALFRCFLEPLAELMLDLGADPHLLDANGFSPFGLWIEVGLARPVRKLIGSRPRLADAPTPWGSMEAYGRPPLIDRPFIIASCSSSLAPALGNCPAGLRPVRGRSALLDELCALGADPTLLDANGLDAYQRSGSPLALAHIERHLLTRGSPSRANATTRRI